MPRVERYQGDQVRTRPLPDIRRTPPPTGAFGEQFGEAVRRVGPVVAQIQQDVQQRADELALTVGKRQFNELYQLSALSDREHRGANGTNGLLTMEGLDPHDKMQGNFEDWNNQADMIVSQAKNPRQRALLEALRDNERARYFDQAMTHASTQLGKYATGQRQATLASSIETAIGAGGTVGSEPVVESHLATIDELVDRYGDDLGLFSPAQRAQAKQQSRSKVHLGILNKLISGGDDLAAQAYYDRVTRTTEGHTSELVASDDAAVRDKLETSSTNGWALRTSESIWQEFAPKNANDPVRIFDMQTRARELATVDGQVDTKKYERTVLYLKSKQTEWESQKRSVEGSTAGPLWVAVAKGATATQVQALPGFGQVSADEQAKLLNAAYDKERQRLADARAAASAARERQDDDIRAYSRNQARIEMGNNAVYTEATDPQVAAALNRDEFIAKYTPLLSDRQLTQALNKFEAVQANVAGASAAQVDRNMVMQVAAQVGGLDYALKATGDLTQPQRATVGALLDEVDRQVVAAEAAYTQNTGRKRRLDQNEQRALVEGIVRQKVFIERWGTDTQTFAALVKADDVGNAYVKWADIPEVARKEMRDEIRKQPARAGARTRALTDAEIDARYQHLMEKALGSKLVNGAGSSHWKTILQGASPWSSSNDVRRLPR